MAKLSIPVGTSNCILQLYLQDTAGAACVGLGPADVNIGVRSAGTSVIPVSLVAVPSLGQYVSGGFGEIGHGWYEFHVPNALLATSLVSIAFMLSGAARPLLVSPLPFELQIFGQLISSGAGSGTVQFNGQAFFVLRSDGSGQGVIVIPFFEGDGASTNSVSFTTAASSALRLTSNGIGSGRILTTVAANTTVVITQVAVSGSNAVYSYSSYTGPAPAVGSTIQILGFNFPGNNVTAVITGVTGGIFGGTITVALSSQENETSPAIGLILVGQTGSGAPALSAIFNYGF